MKIVLLILMVSQGYCNAKVRRSETLLLTYLNYRQKLSRGGLFVISDESMLMIPRFLLRMSSKCYFSEREKGASNRLGMPRPRASFKHTWFFWLPRNLSIFFLPISA